MFSLCNLATRATSSRQIKSGSPWLRLSRLIPSNMLISNLDKRASDGWSGGIILPTSAGWCGGIELLRSGSWSGGIPFQRYTTKQHPIQIKIKLGGICFISAPEHRFSSRRMYSYIGSASIKLKLFRLSAFTGVAHVEQLQWNQRVLASIRWLFFLFTYILRAHHYQKS